MRAFLDTVPGLYRDLYMVWFRTGGRPSEILAVRFDWLDLHRQTVMLRLGRIARWGGVEAPPKTGPREVDCRYDPEIFAAFERCRRAALGTGHREYVFTDPAGTPLSQEWLHKRVWLPTLRRCGLHARGQYNIRDTFITNALRRGSGLGGAGLRDVRADDFPALPPLDAGAIAYRWPADCRPFSGLRHRPDHPAVGTKLGPSEAPPQLSH